MTVWTWFMRRLVCLSIRIKKMNLIQNDREPHSMTTYSQMKYNKSLKFRIIYIKHNYMICFYFSTKFCLKVNPLVKSQNNYIKVKECNKNNRIQSIYYYYEYLMYFISLKYIYENPWITFNGFTLYIILNYLKSITCVLFENT